MSHTLDRLRIAAYCILASFMIAAPRVAVAASHAQHSATTAEIDRWTGPTFIPLQIQCVGECSAPVRWPHDGATVVRDFRGYVPVTLFTGRQVIAFHHLIKRPRQSIFRGGIKFTFVGLKPVPGETWRADLTARLPGPPQSAWNQSLQIQIQSNIQMHGPNGHISKRGLNLSGEQFWRKGRVFHIAGTYHGKKPTELDIPLLTKEINTRACFRIHDIPIP